jgi:HEAT repeat protein/cyclophilin family peptidyl-prolyl cis-trans isomerase
MIQFSSRLSWLAAAAASLVFLVPPSPVHAQSRRPLSASDIDDIARLEMLEDRRQFDSLELSRILASKHPEVRRRAAVSIGRINDKRGIGLIVGHALDADTAVAASEVFAIGQLRDSATVPWLDSLLNGAHTRRVVAGEAAIALGKIKTAGARAVLLRFLAAGVVDDRNTLALREALLSAGRSNARGDIAPLIRWTRSPNEEVRWRATWALFRPKDPAAVPTLLAMAKDRSPVVRAWAVRGLTRAQADSVNFGQVAEAQLLLATRDADRPVRTEAIRALGSYSDSTAVATLVAALDSPDSWISVSAAEGLGRMRQPSTIPKLLAATRDQRSCALRVFAMNALQTFSPSDAQAAAIELTRDTVSYCRTSGAQLLARALTGANAAAVSASQRTTIDSALAMFRAARRSEVGAGDLQARVTAIRSLGTFGDTTDLAALRSARERNDSLSAIGAAAATALATIERRASGQGRGGGRPAAVMPTRTFDDYRRIVRDWIVPDYNGAAKPTAEWTTTRGTFVLELYPGDAPLATDDFMRTMNAGTMVGTEFTRVVPDFVDQQASIRGGNILRDEVNRRGLTRANLAWATAGLDTGTPGYTLGHTPQPHNEGDFTSLGHVIRGMDVVDRIEQGDRILSARMLPPR